jgi:hemolysin D
MSLFDTKDKHEFQPLLVEIEQKPTSPLSRVLLWSLIVFMIISLLWLFLAKIDVVVTAHGKVIPQGEIKILQPIETGTISSIFVSEGMKVKKGDILMELDPSVTSSNSTSKQQNLNTLNLEIERISALIKNKEFNPTLDETVSQDEISNQKLLFNAIKNGFNNQINALKDQISQANSQIKSENTDKSKINQLLENLKQKEKRLVQVKDIIAKNDYEDVTNKIVEYTQESKIRDVNIKKLVEKINEINHQLLLQEQEYHNKLLEELTKKTKEATILQTELTEANFRQAKQKIIAPVDGYVGKMFFHTIGGVVTPAEKLLTLIPNDVPLVIKATVLNQDIGFIEKDMDVALKIDTFDFQKYGLINGVVTHISQDAIEDEKLGLVYDILVTPEKYNLMVDGQMLNINIGMGVTAELKVGKRRVIEFFVYPIIKYLDEGMSVR